MYLKDKNIENFLMGIGVNIGNYELRSTIDELV